MRPQVSSGPYKTCRSGLLRSSGQAPVSETSPHRDFFSLSRGPMKLFLTWISEMNQDSALYRDVMLL